MNPAGLLSITKGYFATYDYIPISLDYFRQALRHDPIGKMYWRTRPLSHFANADIHEWWNEKFAGKEAGSQRGPHGCATVTVNKDYYRACRVAWALHYGKWPEKEVYNINGDLTDNRISNLSENAYDVCKTDKSREAGITQLSVSKKWHAAADINGKRKSIGTFDTEEEAITARKEAIRAATANQEDPDGSDFV